MAVRPSLNSRPPARAAAPEPAPTAAPPPPPPAEARRAPVSTVPGYRPPRRQGKRAAVAWLEPEAVKQLGIMAIEGDTTVQDLLVEAVNDLFAKHGRPRFDAVD
ncbi:ribbon-helix-helix domain-containing protein [Paracraurococcus ruber]|uniref:ribbon-helix-helix domain-containing protein n=1 Tax=Paracraurococcus ruber TaxID=77675 RepID=UPI0010580F6C|nr:ribbon-helix-helix domain-containing protein [Paracraurococcus ruber]TDG27680.1 hypothetical protein E2C05_22175 [Paracraurococcus ruber]